MSLKPVFHQPPMLNLLRLPLAPGQVRSNEPQARLLYRHLSRLCELQGGASGIPECWEPLYLLAILSGEKERAGELQAMIDQGMGEQLTFLAIQEVLCRLRAGAVVFQHYPSAERLKVLMAGIRTLADRWDEVAACQALMSSPADLAELLGWLFQASGTAGLLTLGTMLQQAAMDWCSILATHQQTRDCLADKEIRAYGALLQQEDGNPAFPATYEMYTAHGEKLADAMRYTLWMGIMTGSKTQLNAARTGYERISKWHGAVGGGWREDCLLAGQSAHQGMDTAVLGALCEGLAAQLMVTGGEWAIPPLELLVNNALSAAIGEESVFLLQRDNGLAAADLGQHRFAYPEQTPIHSLCRLARGYVRYFSSTLMVTPQGAAWTVMTAGKYSLPCQEEQLVFTASVDGEEGAWHSLRLSQGSSDAFRLEIYIPGWADRCTLDVNAGDQKSPALGAWYTLEHPWVQGDGVHVQLETSIRWEVGHRQGISFRRGNQLLVMPFERGGELPAVVLNEDDGTWYFTPCADWRKHEGVPAEIPVLPRVGENRLELRLVPYGECLNRIALFPRGNPA